MTIYNQKWDWFEYAEGGESSGSGGDGGSAAVDLSEYLTGPSLSGLFYKTDFGEVSELNLNLKQLVANVTSQTAVNIGWFSTSKGLKKLKMSIPKNEYVTHSCTSMFGWNTDIEEIDFTEVQNPISAFNGFAESARNLKSVYGLDISRSSNNSSCFRDNPNLTNVTIKENGLTKNISFGNAPLSVESIESIVNGLKDLTGETAQTLTLSSTAKAKLTDEQIATITSKNWTLA